MAILSEKQQLSQLCHLFSTTEPTPCHCDKCVNSPTAPNQPAIAQDEKRFRVQACLSFDAKAENTFWNAIDAFKRQGTDLVNAEGRWMRFDDLEFGMQVGLVADWTRPVPSLEVCVRDMRACQAAFYEREAREGAGNDKNMDEGEEEEEMVKEEESVNGLEEVDDFFAQIEAHVRRIERGEAVSVDSDEDVDDEVDGENWAIMNMEES